jgi:hypothetical protein
MRDFKWLGIVLLYTIGWGQQPDTTGNRPALQGRDAGRDAFRAAMRAEPAARDAALRDLIRTGHEEVATDALMALIVSRAPDLETTSLGLLPRLSDPLSDVHMANILGAAARTRDMHFRAALARGVLQRFANDPPPPRADNDGSGAAGLAAVVLMPSADAADRLLLDRVLRVRPHDTGLWLALSKMGIVGQDELNLARAVMRDKQVPGRTRLAAGAALAPVDAGAREYVVSTLTSFLTTYGPTDAALVLGQAMRPAPSSYESTRSNELLWNIRYLGTLEFLQTPDAERLTFEYIDSANEFVRRGLGLVAVMRWPERFLTRQSPYLGERTKLLAALSILHPELLSRVQAIVPPDELDKMRQQMLNDGIEPFFHLPGGAGLVLL